MNTVHEDGARKALRSWIRNPEGSKALADFEERLQAGEFDAWFIDTVGQDYRYHASKWDMEQVLMLMVVHMDIIGGKVGLVDVCLWDGPSRDTDREGNQAGLDLLPDPFVGRVDEAQYGTDSDGWLEWSEPIRVEVATGRTTTGPNGRPAPILVTVMVRPQRVPIEIGYTQPSRTLAHIREGFGVARWPYSHEKVRIFLNMEHLMPEVVWSHDAVRDGCSCHKKLRDEFPTPESLQDAGPLPHQEASEQ